MSSVSGSKGLVVLSKCLEKCNFLQYVGLCFPDSGNDRNILLVRFIKKFPPKSVVIRTIEERYGQLQVYPIGNRGLLNGGKLFFRRTRTSIASIWHWSRNQVLSEQFDAVILHGLNRAVNLGIIPPEKVMELIDRKPHRTHLVMTGGEPHPWICEMCDFVFGEPDEKQNMVVLKQLHKES